MSFHTMETLISVLSRRKLYFLSISKTNNKYKEIIFGTREGYLTKRFPPTYLFSEISLKKYHTLER